LEPFKKYNQLSPIKTNGINLNPPFPIFCIGISNKTSKVIKLKVRRIEITIIVDHSAIDLFVLYEKEYKT